MDYIAVWFDHLRDLNRFLQMIAFLDKLIAGKPEFNREERSDSFPAGFEYFNSQTASVFQRSAVFVLAVIEHRGEELVDQPAVAAMDH